MIRIGVYEPKGDDQVQGAALQQHMVNSLMDGKIEAVAVGSEEEAKNLSCDYTLASDFLKIKSASKVGGLLKAIKNSDPNAASSFTIEAAQTLVKLSDGSIRLQPKINGKFDGKIEMAAEKAMDDGCNQVLKALK
jgi:acylphosphatase